MNGHVHELNGRRAGRIPDRIFARPIIPILVAFMVGIVLGDRLPGWGGVAIGTSAAGLFLVAWPIWRRGTAIVGPVILFIAIGYCSIQSWTAPDFPSDHVSHYALAKTVAISGVIVESPVVRPYGQRLIVEAENLHRDQGDISISGRIQVSVGANNGFDLKRGDRIRVRGRLKRVVGFHNPGGFNYERHLAFQRIWCRMWVASKRVILLDRPTSITILGRIDDLRQTVGRRIERTVAGESEQVLKALVIGDRTGILPSLRETFNRTGTGHLLAISGLHIGIVASVSFFLFRWLLSFSKILLHRAWAGKFAAVFTFVPVAVYGVMAGMSPSTQRAVIMVTVFLLAYLAGKLQDAFNTLAVAGFIILAVHPPALFSISFQLSFAAVAFIILGMSRPWPKDAARNVPRLPLIKKAGSLVAGTVLATLGTLPLVMQTFNEVSLIGVGTNLLAVPLVGLVVVPAGLLGMFTHSVSTLLSTTSFSVAAYVLDFVLAGLNLLADLPMASQKTFTPSTVEIGLYYIMATTGMILAPSFLSYLKGLNQRRQSGLTDPVRLKILVAILLLAGGASLVDGGYWAYQRFWRGDLRVTVIDVGTGSAALLEFPKGQVILIDGGGFGSNAVFDVGARVVAPFLWRKKIMKVDTLVLSHPNSDHLNGLIYIAKHFRVRRLWSNGEPADTDSYRAFKAVVAQNKITSPPFDNLPRTSKISGVDVHILYPPRTFMQQRTSDPWRDTNNNSLVVKVAMGDFSFLFPGDIEKRAEKELTSLENDALTSTILVAPHHGSRTSSTPGFLDVVSPHTVIFSCAQSGRYHLPHPTVFKRYRAREIQMFSTARHGAIQMVTDGHQINIRPTVQAVSDIL